MVRDAARVRDAVVAGETGPVRTVDTVVTAVGGYHPPGGDSLEDLAEQWAADWSLNVMTAVLLLEALRPALAERSGRVVAVSYVAAETGGGGPYSSAKAALEGWARAAARELAPSGISVNVVGPGYVQDTEFFGKVVSARRHQQLSAAALTREATTPEQVADAIAWLAQESSGQVTGQVVTVDGGSVLTKGTGNAR
jgi:3-oxoacyl-[acyl-carrier protein] reductase